MKSIARSVVVIAAVVFATLSSSACTSVFPAGTFDWGHGAVPMRDGGVRVQAGGGGGAGLYGIGVNAFGAPVLGGGVGGALEYQVNQALLLRVEGGTAVQTPGAVITHFSFPSSTSVAPYTRLYAGYVGSQFTMSFDKTVALRLRVGGGLEDSPPGESFGGNQTLYAAAEWNMVKTYVVDENFEWWVAGGAGVKAPFIIFDGIASLGGAWRVGTSGRVYLAGRGGLVLQVPVPTPIASVQVGYTHEF